MLSKEGECMTRRWQEVVRGNILDFFEFDQMVQFYGKGETFLGTNLHSKFNIKGKSFLVHQTNQFLFLYSALSLSLSFSLSLPCMSISVHVQFKFFFFLCFLSLEITKLESLLVLEAIYSLSSREMSNSTGC